MPKFLIMLMAAGALTACSSSDAPQQSRPAQTASVSGTQAPPGAQAAVRSLVERFGRQMKKVSTLAPPAAMHKQLQAIYGDLLSPQLLQTWQAHPQQVVGRKVSSPWPQRIEVKQVACTQADACRATGSVDYVTSNELANGGVFMRRAITLQAARTEAGWRITAVHLAPVRKGQGGAGR